MTRTLPILVLFASALVAAADGRVFDVKQFGAKPDGQTLCTTNIQRAIDECAAAGDGVVSISDGSFVSGTLTLRSRVELRVEAGATLLGSTNLADYPPAHSRMRHLIGGEDLADVVISGPGTIDGRGSMAAFPGEMAITNRPYGICLERSTNVSVRNITLRNSAFWMQRYIQCERLRIRGVTVWNHANYNNDGLDVDDCHDVVIADTVVDADDDAICLKSHRPRGCEDVLITNCVARSHANAFKFGTASAGGFKRVQILDCVVRPSAQRTKIYGHINGLSGVALEVVDGGAMANVLVSGLDITGTRAPIFVRLGDRSRRFGDSPGSLRNVTIEKVTARGAGELGCAIAGIAGSPIENLILRNIVIESAGGGVPADAARKLQARDSAYPECHMFGSRLPAYGLFFWHVNGLTLDNITLRTRQPDARPRMLFEQVQGARINGRELGQSSRDLQESRRLVQRSAETPP